jgi:aromatic-L-amino-acid/L-tryptophan decarboxylase
VHGADAIRGAIERNLRQAALLASLVDADPSFELLVEPQLSAVCFRHVSPAGTDPDEHNAALARAVAADGRILLAPAEVDGATALRACFVNYRTTDEDVRAILPVVSDVATSAPSA